MPPAPTSPRPFLELRVGGLRLTLRHPPVRLIGGIATLSGAIGGFLLAR